MLLPVLVVEDSNINRDVAILQLKALGLDSDVAVTGTDAVTKARTNTYSLILMDVMMPEMDGWEAAQLIRQYESPLGLHTPIVGVSAWAGSDNKERCLLAGMDDYIDKPYDRAALKVITDRWIFARK